MSLETDQTLSPASICEDDRTGVSIATLQRAILDHLYYLQGRVPNHATKNDWYMALAYVVRDRIMGRWIKAVETLEKKETRMVGYLSAEYLPGPHLLNGILNLGICDQVRAAVKEFGLTLAELAEQEEEPGLGNGGLGRLAACYVDSLATLRIPAVGYGIRYEYGIFEQKIQGGRQVEVTDKWLRRGNPWEIEQAEIVFDVGFGGRVESYHDPQGNYQVRWIPERVVKGVAYDTPVPGYRIDSVSLLRLWKAEAVESFDFQAFNVGDYYGAVQEKVSSETISKVLYPNDEPAAGKQLRLAQQYFFVSCSLQDMIRLHLLSGHPLDSFHDWFAIQLNDTHPSIAVAELMRLLVDEYFMGWEESWEITRRTFSYTNHTLLPEALEKWPVPLFRQLLPRHLEIIFEINRRFLDVVRAAFPGDGGKLQRLSLIDERDDKYVRMAHLACAGSHAVNGVAAIHSELLKKTVLQDFYELTPEKFVNITNGVTPRRWLVLSNPDLARLISSRIGDRWISHLEDLRELEKHGEDEEFRRQWRQVKRVNKQNLAAFIHERTKIVVDPESLFDIQVKRIHEYKRQHLNVLHIITLYQRLKNNPRAEMTPRTFIFGGKAAPGYFMAKLMIRLISAVGEVVNHDADVGGRLKVVFFPNFNVKNGQRVYPAADLSEQISLAGKEASGTGNMKFSMNGALTIGTLDGANVEIREEVGKENFFLFGRTVEEVQDLKTRGYHPRHFYDSNQELREAIDLVAAGHFSNGDRNLFQPLIHSLLVHDEYLLLADYASYLEAQEQAGLAYRDPERWTRMSILNVARIGKFSSDRSIREYCEKIWQVEPGGRRPF
ncbi:MAG: glycogen/starch/alpha-glucan phosphorylase [Deltaproteobacteria bacterium]|nr:glycogen/starch/alpha-glucan phosphorylase [Deltaproteobacteria bacterium]